MGIRSRPADVLSPSPVSVPPLSVHTREGVPTMPHALTASWRRMIAVLATLGLATATFIYASPPADALTRSEKKEFMQMLVAQEKLSYDVLTDMAEIHPRGPFRLMARAEEQDLQRIRRLLRIHGWEDLTKGDAPGQFRNFPLIEQTYFDMFVDGQGSVADGARVGVALQQMSLGMLYELLDTRLTKRDRKQLNYTRSYATSRMSTFWWTVNQYG